ncbi:hypothetical protein DFH08DRAFT_966802 [Mycena albidolilacea]|uniref:CRAL-TRIO domain-containing protein n=1 Tax=Mycena albidolilacea TaxID=1033008 RepID=A0AAD6ZPB4_9AGAR|nr:hypothetical protein DFH08DRAFT_966802 [Mycena albidolilacea]
MMFQYTNSLRLPARDAYYPLERQRLDLPDTLPRYLRAAKWQLDDAKKRIKSTIEWRRSYQPDLIAAKEVRLESETGILILNGFDNEGRPILYRQIRHLVWGLERARDLMPPGQESLVIIVDYKSTTLRTKPVHQRRTEGQIVVFGMFWG